MVFIPSSPVPTVKPTRFSSNSASPAAPCFSESFQFPAYGVFITLESSSIDEVSFLDTLQNLGGSCALFGSVITYFDSLGNSYLSSVFMNYKPSPFLGYNTSLFEAIVAAAFVTNSRRLLSSDSLWTCVDDFCDSQGLPCQLDSIPCVPFASGPITRRTPSVSTSPSTVNSDAILGGGTTANSSSFSWWILLLPLFLICLICLMIFCIRRHRKGKQSKVNPEILDNGFVAAGNDVAIDITSTPRNSSVTFDLVEIAENCLLNKMTFPEKSRTSAIKHLEDLQPHVGIALQQDNSSVVIAGVTENGSGYFAGLKKGDVITAFDDKQIGNGKYFTQLVDDCMVGDKVKLSIQRTVEHDGKPTTQAIQVLMLIGAKAESFEDIALLKNALDSNFSGEIDPREHRLKRWLLKFLEPNAHGGFDIKNLAELKDLLKSAENGEIVGLSESTAQLIYAYKSAHKDMTEKASDPFKRTSGSIERSADRLRELLNQAVSAEGVSIENEHEIDTILASSKLPFDSELDSLHEAYKKLGPMGSLSRLKNHLQIELELRKVPTYSASTSSAPSSIAAELAVRLSSLPSQHRSSSGDPQLDSMIDRYQHLQLVQAVATFKNTAQNVVAGSDVSPLERAKLNACMDVLNDTASTGNNILDEMIRSDKQLKIFISNYQACNASSDVKALMNRYISELDMNRDSKLRLDELKDSQVIFDDFVTRHPNFAHHSNECEQYDKLLSRLAEASKAVSEIVSNRENQELKSAIEEGSYPYLQARNASSAESRLLRNQDLAAFATELRQFQNAVDVFLERNPACSSPNAQCELIKLQTRVTQSSTALQAALIANGTAHFLEINESRKELENFVKLNPNYLRDPSKLAHQANLQVLRSEVLLRSSEALICREIIDYASDLSNSQEALHSFLMLNSKDSSNSAVQQRAQLQVQVTDALTILSDSLSKHDVKVHSVELDQRQSDLDVFMRKYPHFSNSISLQEQQFSLQARVSATLSVVAEISVLSSELEKSQEALDSFLASTSNCSHDAISRKRQANLQARVSEASMLLSEALQKNGAKTKYSQIKSSQTALDVFMKKNPSYVSDPLQLSQQSKLQSLLSNQLLEAARVFSAEFSSDNAPVSSNIRMLQLQNLESEPGQPAFLHLYFYGSYLFVDQSAHQYSTVYASWPSQSKGKSRIGFLSLLFSVFCFFFIYLFIYLFVYFIFFCYYYYYFFLII
jgi:hypothetical protein